MPEFLSDIVLMGMPAAGKTSVARELAELSNKSFYDTDEIFVSECGRISDFFEKYGEREFRKKEREISIKALNNKGSVVSLGGGAVLDSEIMKAAKRDHIVILLTGDLDVIVKRTESDNGRPLIKSRTDVYEIFKAREKLYYAYADLIFDTSETTPAEAAKKICAMLGNDIGKER